MNTDGVTFAANPRYADLIAWMVDAQLSEYEIQDYKGLTEDDAE